MQLQILGPQARYPRARLVDPPSRGYLHLGAVVEPPRGRAPVTRTSSTKAALLDRLKSLARQAEQVEAVEKVTVFKAVVLPPAFGYAKRPDVHQARYDVVALLKTSSPDDLGKAQASEAYQALHDAMAGAARDQCVLAARCAKSLGDVDKTRPGLFSFNYFVADDVDVALELWEWLTGWYVAETGLDNSALLQPIGDADYAFVNHARWDYGLGRFLLRQFAKPSFRSYVQTNLLVNRTGAMPGLYHLA
jgi:hypothetical protein